LRCQKSFLFFLECNGASPAELVEGANRTKIGTPVALVAKRQAHMPFGGNPHECRPAPDNPYYRRFNCADFQPRDDGQLALVTLLAVFVIDAPIAPTQVTCRFCDPSRPVERTESLPPHAKDFGAAIVSAKAWLYIDSVQILIGGWHRRDV
jgi:hypothetical protein